MLAGAEPWVLSFPSPHSTMGRGLSAGPAMGGIGSTAPGVWDDLARRRANDNAPRTVRSGPARSLAWRLMLALEDALERIRQRRDLAGLSALDLKDLGWTRCDTLSEVSKPFWR